MKNYSEDAANFAQKTYVVLPAASTSIHIRNVGDRSVKIP
jgi:hypothetical protein